MTARGTALLVALAILGVGVAFGIGLAANAISGDSIGLSAKSLHAGEDLAPAQAREDRSGPGGGDATTTTTPKRTTPKRTTPKRTTPTTTTTTTEPGDDNGGRSRGGSGGGSGGGDDSGGGSGRGRGRGGGDD
jgi:hypothetical protein